MENFIFCAVGFVNNHALTETKKNKKAGNIRISHQGGFGKLYKSSKIFQGSPSEGGFIRKVAGLRASCFYQI